MQPAYEIPQFTTTSASPSDIEADLIAVPAAQDQLPVAAFLDQAAGGELTAAYERGEFAGKSCEQWSTDIGAWRTKRVVAIGIGPSGAFNAESARRVGSAIGLTARQQKRKRIAFVLNETWSEALIESLAEGVTLASFDGGHYKSRPDGRVFLTSVTIAGVKKAADSALERGVRVGEAVNAARLLINEPGNLLTPTDLAKRGQALLSVPHVTTEILDRKKMEELKMGLLLGVARGSAEEPRLLVARYDPPDAPRTPVLGLVGKGITFDTGGISIKPSDGMERMKDDMAGGATVIGALRALALEKVPVRAMAIVPCTENMPGGRATKPGDIHTGASGITVEINNTDAEGRLILGDALWYAKEQGATHLVDVATLTGACVVALGKTTTGLWATDGWREILLNAATRGGEKVWSMPLFEEYRESLKSEIADMLNSPGRPAGAVTAAMFLKEFVGTTAWAHLDIAGTAWAEDAKPWMPKGATGVMIRTLVEVGRTAGKGWPTS
jgi:leucyl aminopeptidase